jgi:hypothetical protein
MSPGSAVSGESRAAEDALKAVVRSVETSQALFGGKAAVISDIWALVNECGEPDWDAAGGEPLDRMAAYRAVDLIRALPGSISLPEVGGEPDGFFSLDWIVARHRVFSLSVGAGDRLAYAWVDGSNRGHGVDRFDGETVPPRILQGIREILKHGDTPLGPA